MPSGKRPRQQPASEGAGGEADRGQRQTGDDEHVDQRQSRAVEVVQERGHGHSPRLCFAKVGGFRHRRNDRRRSLRCVYQYVLIVFRSRQLSKNDIKILQYMILLAAGTAALGRARAAPAPSDRELRWVQHRPFGRVAACRSPPTSGAGGVMAKAPASSRPLFQRVSLQTQIRLPPGSGGRKANGPSGGKAAPAASH